MVIWYEQHQHYSMCFNMYTYTDIGYIIIKNIIYIYIYLSLTDKIYVIVK